MKEHHLVMACLLLSFLAPLASSSAQDKIKLEEILVREKKDLTRGDVISTEKLEQTQANDLEDVFRHSPEVIVGGGQAAAQKIYVRGVEDTNLNITVDGARQTSYLFHHQGRLNIAPELLKKVEVSPGTGSALAGPGALGGTIKMTTKEARDLLKDDKEFGALVKLNYKSAASEKGASLGLFGKITKQLDYLVYGSYSDADNYRAGGGEKTSYTKAKPQALLSKLTFTPTDRHKINLSYERKEDNATRLLRNHFGTAPGLNNPASKQEFTNDNLVLNYDYVSENPLLNLHMNFFNTNSFLRRYGNPHNSETIWNTLGSDINNLFNFGKHHYILGLDATIDHSKAKSANGSNDERGEILGVYQEFSHTTSDKLTTTLGLRFDHYKLRDPLHNEYSQSHFSPSLAFDYRWSESLKTTISWSEAFKGVTPMESMLIAGATAVAPLKEELKGTVSQTTQVGAVYEKEALKLSGVAYYTDFLHMLQSSYDRTTGVITRSNGEKLISRGFTLSFDYSFKKSLVGANYNHNKIEYAGEALGYFAFNRGSSQGDRLNLYYDYSLLPEKLNLRFNALIVFDMNDVPEGREKHPGYDIYDLSLTYHLDKKTSTSLMISNIFDREYVAQGSPYIVADKINSLKEPGRDIRLELTRFF